MLKVLQIRERMSVQKSHFPCSFVFLYGPDIRLCIHASQNFKEIKMSKKLIFGIALSLVLVSGGFFGAQADCGCLSNLSPCNWRLSSLSPCNWRLSSISPCNWRFTSLCSLHTPSLCGFSCGSKDVNSASVTDTDNAQCCWGKVIAAPLAAAGAIVEGAVVVSAAIVKAPFTALSCGTCGLSLCNPCNSPKVGLEPGNYGQF